MLDPRVFIGVFAGVGSLFGYALYFRSIFQGKTKPHPFSWLIFLIVDGLAFAAQVVSGGGPGAWVLGVSSFMNGVVFIFALSRGERRIVPIDWICLVCAFAGIVLWHITNDPLAGVVFVTIADGLAKIPTIRKSYLRPNEESMSIWSLDIGKFILSIAALSSLTLTTTLFPAEAAITNALLVVIVLFRRSQLRRA